MAAKVFNLETVHDTARRTMAQSIDPFTVVVDWNRQVVKIIKIKTVIETIDFSEKQFSLDDYEKVLERVEKSANELKAFNHD